MVLKFYYEDLLSKYIIFISYYPKHKDTKKYPSLKHIILRQLKIEKLRFI